jgi:putative transposase
MLALLSGVRDSFRSRLVLQAEILALRHQLLVLQRSSRGRRLRLRWADRVLWVWLSRFWNNWRSALLIVKPETVGDGRATSVRADLPFRARSIELIRKMSLANPGWGAPRIHGELLKIGIAVSQATVAKYMVRQRKPPSQTWRTFLENHAKSLVSVDLEPDRNGLALRVAYRGGSDNVVGGLHPHESRSRLPRNQAGTCV